MRVRVSEIELDVVQDGPAAGVPLVLVRGLGSNLAQWPGPWIERLAAHGLRVVRFDNRDAGRSTPTPWPYCLSDMADDVAGLIDALGLDSAHVLGLSLGGMIAQELAIRAPARVRSLISLMSSSGAPDLPGPSRRALEALQAEADDPEDREQVWRLWLAERRVSGSPRFADSDADLLAEFEAAWEHGLQPEGAARQWSALLRERARWQALARITCPTLVIHGEDDPLVPVACGRDTARRIPGARFVAIAGMGHDLPLALAARLAALVGEFVEEAEQRTRAGAATGAEGAAP